MTRNHDHDYSVDGVRVKGRENVVLDAANGHEDLTNPTPQPTASVPRPVYRHEAEHSITGLDARIGQASFRLSKDQGLAKSLALEVTMIKISTLETKRARNGK